MPDRSEDDLGEALLVIARNAIHARLGEDRLPEPLEPPTQHGACFVTLTQEAALRGCIGTLAAWRPLTDDVRANACAAAFSDPRFRPLSREEAPRTRIEVSLLSAPEPFSFASEQDALAGLRVGIDGVVLHYGAHRSTFLPQVWESLSEPAQFMAQLKLKAGLPPDFWHEDMSLARYQVRKWKETTRNEAHR